MRALATLSACLAALLCSPLCGQDREELPGLGPSKESADKRRSEAEYYKVQSLFIPSRIYLEAMCFEELPGDELAIGTRRGEVWFVKGLLKDKPDPSYRLFASGLHEIFGLDTRDGWLYATTQAEVTRMRDRDGDGLADRFECVSDAFGFGGEHEYTFGSKFDRNGHIWLVLCLTGSYTSKHPFRGWCLRVSADGKTIPTCNGLRSPGGIAEFDGEMFYTESQGPWNGCCSLKHLKPGGFMGHPISNTWYDRAPKLKRPAEPTGGKDGRLHEDWKRIPQLVPPAVWLPYKKMGQSASAIVVDKSGGRFGPFTGQLFIPDYTLSLVSRVYLEKVDGVYQGACFPFRQGFKTGLLGAFLHKSGKMIVGGCSRGWPARGPAPYALERIEWTGKMPFEVLRMQIRPRGFELTFTQEVDPKAAARIESYAMQTYTYHYRKAYGSPEIEKAKPKITKVEIAADRKSVRLELERVRVGHVHELHMPGLRNAAGLPLLHDVAYYTVNKLTEK